jgi:hypothetical protein
MESGFDPLKVKVREHPAWVATAEEVLNGDVCCTLSD